MKVFLATDHTGLQIKDKVNKMLLETGYDVQDCGTFEYDPADDYPDLISKAAAAVSRDPHNARGIIFGGSGQGEMIVANKFKGVRCGLFYAPAAPVSAVDIEGRESTDSVEILRLTREHNGTNMLSIGIRFAPEDDIYTAIKVWLEASDPREERHKRRIDKISKIEEGTHV